MKYRVGQLVHGNMPSKRGMHHYGNPDIIWRIVAISSPSLTVVPYKLLDQSIRSGASYINSYKENPEERWYPSVDQIQLYHNTIHTRLV